LFPAAAEKTPAFLLYVHPRVRSNPHKSLESLRTCLSPYPPRSGNDVQSWQRSLDRTKPNEIGSTGAAGKAKLQRSSKFSGELKETREPKYRQKREKCLLDGATFCSIFAPLTYLHSPTFPVHLGAFRSTREPAYPRETFLNKKSVRHWH